MSKLIDHYMTCRTIQDLVKLLDTNFPHKCAEVGQTTEKIYFYAGKRAIVDFLKSKYGGDSHV